MRSRYSAYATGNVAYVEKTNAGPAAQAFNLLEAAIWAKTSEWLGLEITNRKAGLEGDETGIVSFTFHIRQNGETISASETSVFQKLDGRWYYYDRRQEPKANAAGIGRNDPCSCGSGEKYKKCCGA